MSNGNEFHVRGAATEKARRASSVRVLGTDSSGAQRASGNRSQGTLASCQCRIANVDRCMTVRAAATNASIAQLWQRDRASSINDFSWGRGGKFNAIQD